MESARGAPERFVQTPSPRVANGKAGVDAELVFAADPRSPAYGGTLPVHHTAVEIDVGAGFAHVEPVGGRPASSALSHVYRYDVVGQGAAPRFRLRDVPHHDNYGVLTISIEEVRRAAR